MANNAQKTPFIKSASSSGRRQALDAIQQLGKALPCHVVSISGQIVTVAFDIVGPFTLPNVTMPISTSAYDWLPIQAGDKGVSMAADAYLGGVSDLGGGTASLVPQANLSALVFVPVSNASWSAPDATQRVVQGIGGALIRDTGAQATIDLTPTGVTVTVGNAVFSIANNQITMTVGDSVGLIVSPSSTTINGKEFLTHVHSGVQTGSGDTGPPV